MIIGLLPALVAASAGDGAAASAVASAVAPPPSVAVASPPFAAASAGDATGQVTAESSTKVPKAPQVNWVVAAAAPEPAL